MITPVHAGFNLIIFFLFGFFVDINSFDFFILLSAAFIDLDHLFSSPIYCPKRNPFKTHFFHKNWKGVIVLAVVFLLIRPIAFLGVGLVSHLFLDYVYIRVNRL